MKLTDQIRKRISDYQFEDRMSLKDFHAELVQDYQISYEALRQFWSGSSEANGSTLNAIDEFLTKKGY